MTLTSVALACLVLLLAPGPTNILLALAGAERGWRAALWLIPAVVLGYLLTTVPLALLGAGLMQNFPLARPVITAGAAVWVAWLAYRLWAPLAAGSVSGHGISTRQVFVTTALNPKVLIFGLVLLPQGGPLMPRLAVFVGLIVLVTGFWAGLGGLLTLRAQSGRALPLLRRVAAVFLAIVSVTLVARVVADLSRTI